MRDPCPSGSCWLWRRLDCAGERSAEAGEVGAAVSVRDGVGEAEDLIVVGVVVLENDIGEDVVLGLLAIVVEIDLALAIDDDG